MASKDISKSTLVKNVEKNEENMEEKRNLDKLVVSAMKASKDGSKSVEETLQTHAALIFAIHDSMNQTCNSLKNNMEELMSEFRELKQSSSFAPLPFTQTRNLSTITSENILEVEKNSPLSRKFRLFKHKPNIGSQFKALSSVDLKDFDAVEDNLKLIDWNEISEDMSSDDDTQLYSLVNYCIHNYEKTFAQKSRQAIKIMASLELNRIQPHWLTSTSNAGSVFNCLLKLNEKYPQGCTAQQLAAFEKSVNTSMNNFGSLPSFASLYDWGLLLILGKLFFVASDVLTKYVYLRKNFCSNFYRLLLANEGTITMQALQYVENLVPKNISVSVQNVVQLCNRYPLLFSLISSKDDNHHVECAKVKLNRDVHDWMIVLDCELNCIPGAVCDCQDCVLSSKNA